MRSHKDVQSKYSTLIQGGFRKYFFDTDNIDTAASLACSEEMGTAYAQIASEEEVEIVSSEALDITQVITIIGVDENGLRVTEDLPLDTSDGTTAVTSTTVWRYIEEVRMDVEATGTITVRKATLDTFITGIAIGQLTDGNAQVFPAEKDLYLTSVTVTSSTASDIITAEIRWYPDDADCLDSGDGYVVLDKVIANALLSTHRDYAVPIRCPAGGWLAVFVSANNNDSGGSVMLSGWLEPAVDGTDWM